MAEPILRLEGLCKDYGEGLVLSGLSLDEIGRASCRERV